MRKPTHALVHWSESTRFPGENALMTFATFEETAARAAWANPPRGCYDKTQVTILFSDGSSYGCRIDLKQGDERGFRDHVEQFIRGHEGGCHDNWPNREAFNELCTFLKDIDFETPPTDEELANQPHPTKLQFVLAQAQIMPIDYNRIIMIRDFRHADGRPWVDKGAIGTIRARNGSYVGVLFDEGQDVHIERDGSGRLIQEVPFVDTAVYRGDQS